MIKKKKQVSILILGAALLAACGTKRSATGSSVLQSPPIETSVLDTSDRVAKDVTHVADTPNMPYDSIPTSNEIAEANFIAENFSTNRSTEIEVEELRSTGLHRQYSFAPAMHYDLRRPQYVMIHHTSQNTLQQTIRTFQLAHTKVSAHYVIGRDGQVIQMLNDYMRAWHAGAGKWGQITDMNSVSIGIELDNNGREPFPEVQIHALLDVLEALKNKYQIPQLNFIGHGDYAPARKNDPSVFFPWKTLAERGFGIWYNESFLPTPPPNFNAIDALRIMGYDTRNLPAAVKAFKRKYIQTDVSTELTTYDEAVLYDLYSKYY